jgi:Fur family ferric uptake transcriptional regulator
MSLDQAEAPLIRRWRTYDRAVPRVKAGDGPAGALADRLRSRGLRWTQQRAQVLGVVSDLGHATPEQIAAASPDVDLTTVYRTLELLEELGLVAHTHLGHGAPSYRPADDTHIHVVCHTCGSVIEPPEDLVADLVARLAAERGFSVDLAHFAVFGECSNCSSSTTGPPAPHVHRRAGATHEHGAGAAHDHGEQIHEHRR